MFSTMIWLAAILAGFVAAQFTSSNLTIPSFVDLDRKGKFHVQCHDVAATAFVVSPFFALLLPQIEAVSITMVVKAEDPDD